MDNWSIPEFEEFLQEQEEKLLADFKTQDGFAPVIIRQVFRELFTELKVKAQDEDRKFSVAHGEKC